MIHKTHKKRQGRAVKGRARKVHNRQPIVMGEGWKTKMPEIGPLNKDTKIQRE